jgi:signal transduction histidine kinase
MGASDVVVVGRDGTPIATTERDGRIVCDAVPLHRAPTDVRTLLEGAVEAMQKQAAAVDVTLKVESAPDLPRVVIDPEKVAWAVTSLVGNALRYARRGTRVLPGGVIVVRLSVTDDGMLLIAVEDDGPGIPQEKVDKLFARGSGVRHGAGLGLLVVRDVVAAHGGSVDVKSHCDRFTSGTTVTLHLPIER